jgi:hypothetical protein
MMAAYRKVMSLVRDPKLVVFNMKGKPTDYKSFRYGFTSALMDDAYFDFSDGTGGSVYKTDVVWFDEYDLAGEKNTRWLGPVDPPQTKPWRSGLSCSVFRLTSAAAGRWTTFASRFALRAASALPNSERVTLFSQSRSASPAGLQRAAHPAPQACRSARSARPVPRRAEGCGSASSSSACPAP